MKKDMKQTVEEAAKKYADNLYNPTDRSFLYGEKQKDFIAGANWQLEQSPWVNIEERLPEDDENIIIMCEHGAIFNGTYCNGVWFCMDGYINDTCDDKHVYTSMCSIPPLWEPTHWMPIAKK